MNCAITIILVWIIPWLQLNNKKSHNSGTFYLLLCVHVAILNSVSMEKGINEKDIQILAGDVGDSAA